MKSAAQEVGRRTRLRLCCQILWATLPGLGRLESRLPSQRPCDSSKEGGFYHSTICVRGSIVACLWNPHDRGQGQARNTPNFKRSLGRALCILAAVSFAAFPETSLWCGEHDSVSERCYVWVVKFSFYQIWVYRTPFADPFASLFLLSSARILLNLSNNNNKNLSVMSLRVNAFLVDLLCLFFGGEGGGWLPAWLSDAFLEKNHIFWF